MQDYLFGVKLVELTKFFLVLLLIIFVVGLIYFFLVYFVFDFRSIKFLMGSKMRRMLELYFFIIINY